MHSARNRTGPGASKLSETRSRTTDSTTTAARGPTPQANSGTLSRRRRGVSDPEVSSSVVTAASLARRGHPLRATRSEGHGGAGRARLQPRQEARHRRAVEGDLDLLLSTDELQDLGTLLHSERFGT